MSFKFSSSSLRMLNQLKGSFDRISLLFEKCEPSEREKRFDRLHNLFDLKDDEKWVFKSFATFMKLHGWEQPSGTDFRYNYVLATSYLLRNDDHFVT